MTSFGVAIFAAMGLACSAVLKQQATSLGARAGFVIAFTGAALFAIAVWSRSAGNHSWFLKLLASSFVLSFATAHASLLLLVSLAERFLPIRTLTRTCVYAWAVLLVVMMVIERGDGFLWRLVGATSTVGVFGTVALLVLSKLSSSNGSP